MLHMDFMRGLPLRHDMDAARHNERRDCIRRLFAVLTARLEDAATLAAEGQARTVTREAAAELAAKVQEISTETTAITEALQQLCKQA